MNAYSPIVSLLLAAALLLGARPLFAQNQANDPLVDQQQYLFDVHNVDQAWSYTTGSSNVRLGVYSFLGFTQNHEDLNGPRLQTSRGPLRPEFDYATEVAGIAGANTNNNLGIAGIDRVGELQSYSMLRDYSTGSGSERAITVGGETFYLDLRHFADVIDDGRANGVDVHLALIGLPSGLEADYEDPMEIETPDGMLPDPDDVVPDPPMNIDEAEAQLRNNALEALRDIFLQVLDALCFGSGCTSPPDPMVAFRQSVGNLTRLGDGIVVTPAGDLDGPTTSANLPVSPGELGRYATTVGGLQRNSSDEFVKWDRSNAAPYVDVAGLATSLAGPAAMGFSAYNTDFTSTAGAAAIGAGVASLLRAENSSLTTEDVDQILRRTAIDAGQPGFDEGTGAGRIDAGAALAYVRTNDVQQSNAGATTVLSDQKIEDDIALEDSGYLSYGPCGTQVKADLRKFRIRLPYERTFSSAPDLWLRWGNSDGYNTSRSSLEFDVFSKDLTIAHVDERGFVVEGFYWDADFYSTDGRRCAVSFSIPKDPEDFSIAYTAVGEEGAPPPMVSISGPSVLNSGDTGTWTASVDGGSGSTNYSWAYQSPGSVGYSPAGCSGSSCTRTFYNFGDRVQSGGMQVTVTKGGESDTESMTVSVSPSCGDNVLICRSSKSSVFVLRALRAQSAGSTVRLSWQTAGSDPPSRFTIEHRADTTAAWSGVGKVPVADSIRSDTTQGMAYRYSISDLDVGRHQFRVGIPSMSKRNRYSSPVSAQVTMDGAYRLSAYPNPVRNTATIELAVHERQTVSVEVYDVLGRRVTTLHNGPLPGQQSRQFSLNVERSDLASGTYFLRVEGESFTEDRQLTVVQ